MEEEWNKDTMINTTTHAEKIKQDLNRREMEHNDIMMNTISEKKYQKIFQWKRKGTKIP